METKILTPRQIAFLENAGREPFISENFYLTGGTALAAFYLRHRYSEDLDFFSEKEFDLLGLDVFLNRLRKVLSVSTLDFQKSYNRNLFFLYFEQEVLKIEFTFFPFPRMELSGRQYGVTVDGLLDIAVNKLFSIYQRTNARDYIDLYFICQDRKFSIPDLILKAKAKFDWHIDPLQLGTQFVNATEARDYPRMVKDISPEEWQSFFIKEAKKLKSEIVS